MAEETKPTPESTAAKPPEKGAKPKKAKPPKLEDKPFGEFMEQHFTPALIEALKDEGVADIELMFTKQAIPIQGASSSEQCWQVVGKWLSGNRQFNLYFIEENITGQKAFSSATDGNQPSTIESFMIDERRVTLDLMVLYTVQRLNSQKWLSGN